MESPVLVLQGLGVIMLLKEFFSKQPGNGQNSTTEKEQNEKINNDLFWFIIDHDKLHKDYFFPIAKELKKKNCQCENNEVLEMFMPMVIKGCREYYEKNKMAGKLGKKFSKELREEMCKRLYEHYREGILKNKYKLG